MSQTINNHLEKKGFLSKVREIFFPIYGAEIVRFLPMAIIMFFILFNYTVLRNVKDTLVINGKGAEGEIISYIKLWGTMPAAILFLVLFSKMTNVMSREKIFYTCVGFFIFFFGAFAFLIYPNIEYLHPSTETVHNLQAYFPNLKMFIAMWGNWTYCLFYVFAELWGSAVVSLFFWQFANDITSPSEARRFYPLYGAIGNLGLILAGKTTKYFTKMSSVSSNIDPWQVSLNYLMGAIVVCGVITIVLYYYVNKKASSAIEELKANRKEKKSKPKLGIVDSFKYILSSKHLMYIAIMVLAYGMTMNYIDVLWKGQVKLLSKGQNNASAAYFGTFSEITGWLSIALMLVGGAFLRRFGWYKSACVVPTVLGISAILFFGAIIYGNMLPPGTPMIEMFGITFTSVFIAAQIGTFSGAFTKASKYSLFDSTREMAYMPLDSELRSKGKAAVDVTGGRLGKSGGSATIFALTMLFPSASLPTLTPYLAGFTVLIIIGWFIAATKLNKSLKCLENDSKEETGCIKAQLQEQPAK